MTQAEPGTVYLVGAGPGDPELLTLRALRLLGTADAVFHDDLVSDEIVTLAQPGARVVSVGKRCGRARVTQAEIHGLLVEAARAGERVVRLKSGDPLIFGRAGEEIAALRTAGVRFVVVPGITAALAAGAALQIPLTDRGSASKLLLATGHHAKEKDVAPVWSGPLPADATLAVYMPGRDLGRLGAELLATGLSVETPVAAVSHAATKRQTERSCQLGELARMEAGPAPLLLLVGEALRPLLGS